MKSIRVISTFFVLTFFSCDNDTSSSSCNPPCDPLRKTVKTVTDKEGWIDYSADDDKWMIVAASSPVTYDAQDLGLLCNDLEEKFKQVGIEVKFSGEYKEKCGDSKGDFAGQTYYYLHISKIEIN